MLCQICQKNPATLHIEEVVGSTKTTLHLCSDCAKTTQTDDHAGDNNLKLAALAYQLASDKLKALHGEAGALPNVPHQICKKCSTTLAEYHNTGRLGCPECYDSFREHMQPILEHMHRGTSHSGTAPPDAKQATKPPAPNADTADAATQNGTPEHPPQPPPEPASETIARLRKQLDQAVKNENYEQAAKLRDRLRALTSADTPPKP
ncbi:MAG: UvrB/UvrC motif-containing protein [Verrucomicrobiota bacterium]